MQQLQYQQRRKVRYAALCKLEDSIAEPSFPLHRPAGCGIVSPFPLCNSGFHAFGHRQSDSADEG